MVEHAIIDKKVRIGEKAHIGKVCPQPAITMVGKSCRISPEVVIEQGVIIGPDVIETDFEETTVREGGYLQTKREPFDV